MRYLLIAVLLMGGAVACKTVTDAQGVKVTSMDVDGIIALAPLAKGTVQDALAYIEAHRQAKAEAEAAKQTAKAEQQQKLIDAAVRILAALQAAKPAA